MTRLTLPLRFRTVEHAASTIEASGLFPIGARPVQVGGRWFVVIEARNAEPVLRHLRATMPGIEWTVTDNAPAGETP
jgi:hypothetical protein